ncbi:MAG TPA: hypothetical protein DIU15_00360, partial [Deltaproteobacteria bacterium]|nr:hypothetical protein [Deltaproteobacteria bacterium]
MNRPERSLLPLTLLVSSVSPLGGGCNLEVAPTDVFCAVDSHCEEGYVCGDSYRCEPGAREDEPNTASPNSNVGQDDYTLWMYDAEGDGWGGSCFDVFNQNSDHIMGCIGVEQGYEQSIVIAGVTCVELRFDPSEPASDDRISWVLTTSSETVVALGEDPEPSQSYGNCPSPNTPETSGDDDTAGDD